MYHVYSNKNYDDLGDQDFDDLESLNNFSINHNLWLQLSKLSREEIIWFSAPKISILVICCALFVLAKYSEPRKRGVRCL